MQIQRVLQFAQRAIFAKPRAADDEGGALIACVEGNSRDGKSEKAPAIFRSHDISHFNAQYRLGEGATLSFQLRLPVGQFFLETR